MEEDAATLVTRDGEVRGDEIKAMLECIYETALSCWANPLWGREPLDTKENVGFLLLKQTLFVSLLILSDPPDDNV